MCTKTIQIKYNYKALLRSVHTIVSFLSLCSFYSLTPVCKALSNSFHALVFIAHGYIPCSISYAKSMASPTIGYVLKRHDAFSRDFDGVLPKFSFLDTCKTIRTVFLEFSSEMKLSFFIFSRLRVFSWLREIQCNIKYFRSIS